MAFESCRALRFFPASHFTVKVTLLQNLLYRQQAEVKQGHVLGCDVENILGIHMWGTLVPAEAQHVA